MPQRPDIRRVFKLGLFRRAGAAVEEEFAFHLDMRVSELIAQGWQPEAARAEARRQFGDLEDARKYCRQADEQRERQTMRGELWEETVQDIRFAVRSLRRAPAFSLVAAMTLAIGIGANTAIFSVVRGILLRPMPFTDPSRLVMVASLYGGKQAPSSPANVYDWRAQNKSFTSMAVITGHSAVLTGAGDPEQIRGLEVGGDYFSILGVTALLGRSAFSPEDTAWKGTKSVLVNELLWRTHFGSDPKLVGSMLTLDNERYRVIGIIPGRSAWPTKVMLWFPFTYDPADLAHSRGAVYLNTVARLKPGATIASAAADMRALAARLAQQYPNEDTNVGADVVPMQEWITGDLRLPLLTLLGGVAFVLLIACANVANLLLVRGVAREGELAVRTALGAGRGRLVRQLVTESMVLSLFGGAIGFLLAIVGTRLLVAAAPTSIPRLDSIRVDGGILIFTLAIAAITGAIFGLMPARQMLRPDISKTLREGGRGVGQRAGNNRARRVLVVAEVALSVVLLAGAGLLIRSFSRLMNVDPGFRTDHSISFALSLPDAKYKTPEQQATFLTTVMERMRALPGVQSAGAGLGMPLTNYGFGFSFTVAGRAALKPSEEPDAEVRVATPEYFPTMGIRIVRGRGITPEDNAGAARVLLITEAAAKKFFPNENPLGKHVKFGWSRDSVPLQGDIVGIVADVKQSSLAQATLPQFWAPFDQWPMSNMTVVLHTARDVQAVVADARRAIHELDPDLAIAHVTTLENVVADSVAQPRFYMMLLTAFAIIAILLASIGIYGVIAYLVGQRAREIGIRIALGASPSNVVRLVVNEGVVMVAIGIGVGIVGAIALTQLMRALLFNTTSTDPMTYILVTLLLAAVALVASSVPAMRAANVDPALAMRAE
ncbi:MAG TPA: ABC transporter permease [Gemmatimonadaceae bacterium]|nr:ABC transporter permease [Gemmatimonadaceae bacterium]